MSRQVSTHVKAADVIEEHVKNFAACVPLEASEMAKVKFIAEFAKWLLRKGFIFRISFNSDKKMMIFSSHQCEGKPIINLKYEAGIQPECYWIKKLKPQSNFFNDIQVGCDNPSHWFGITYNNYSAKE